MYLTNKATIKHTKQNLVVKDST